MDDHIIEDRNLGRIEPVLMPSNKTLPKIGRNEACPCGSGRKFKNCHGGLGETGWSRQPPTEVSQKLLEMDAMEQQRQKQQGSGRPIISTTAHGHRIVAVGNRLFFSQGWKTFHDFLWHYIKVIMDGENGVMRSYASPQASVTLC